MTGKHRVALIIPFIIIGVLLAWHIDRQHHGGQVWQVKISGYDPRDLLYGHYLSYRYDWTLAPHRDIAGGASCLCLTSSGNGSRDPLATPVSCLPVVPLQCDSIVAVYDHAGTYGFDPDTAAERYFITEATAMQTEDILRDPRHIVRLELRVHDDHSVAVVGLMVDDMPVETYLARQQ